MSIYYYYSLSTPRKDIVVGVYSYLFIDIVIDRQMGKKLTKLRVTYWVRWKRHLPRSGNFSQVHNVVKLLKRALEESSAILIFVSTQALNNTSQLHVANRCMSKHRLV